MAWHQTIVIGNVGRDPELRYLQSGVAVCDFSVAVSESWTDSNTNERREKTTWYRVAAWGRLGEICNQYIQKGRQVMVVGTVEARAYTDKSGQPAASLELRARDVRFLGSRADREGGAAGGNYDDFSAPAENIGDIPF
jgi:single-strand DNA-binding protein